MNKKTFISILLLLSLGVVLIVFFNNKSNDNTTIKETINHNSDKQASTKNIEQNSKLSPKVLPIEGVTDEIQNFNEQIANDLSILDNEISKERAVDRLSSKQRNNSLDVIETINKYYDDIAKYQIEVKSLVLLCKRSAEHFSQFEKKISQTNQELTESTFSSREKITLKANSRLTEDTFNQYYFFKGLIESNICKDLNTLKDPFFAIVKAARQGDLLSRLLLVDHLVFAMQRKLINPWKHPLEYMNLRDEAISYLKILAAKGVTRASVKLAQIYSNGIIAPPNRILEYYYSFLAKKQEGVEVVYLREPSDIYYHLTEKQKTIADRMTENL